MSTASLGLTIRRLLGKSTTVAYTGTASAGVKLPQSCASVMVWTDSAAYIGVGNAGLGASYVATTTDIPVPANVPVIIPVERPTSPTTDPEMYVSAVRVSASGTLYMQPLAD